MSPSQIPVIVGVGQVNDSGPGDPGPDACELMARALTAADVDGGGGWLHQIEFLGVENQISSAYAAWPSDEPITPFLTAMLGIDPAKRFLTEEPSGDGPVLLLDKAAAMIGSGEIACAAIVGGEGLRTAARRAATAQGEQRNAVQDLLDSTVSPFLKTYGLVTPIDVYPLYEGATRAAWGQTMAEAMAESAQMAEGYSQAATQNDAAALSRFYSAEEIATTGDRNRMVTFPYTKLMVANSAVNQGAAVIVTSLAKAREMGLKESALVYVGSGAAAAEPDDFLARDGYDASPAMTASIATALDRNGLDSADLDCVELYNCFPCVPKMARRVLGWPLDKLPSVYGGLVFGGGPLGNCMMHALVMMTRRLRGGERHGLVFANGGFATHNHTIVLTRDADRAATREPDFDVQGKANALRGAIPPLDETYVGRGRVEAYTAPCGRDGHPRRATIVGRGSDGARFVALVKQDDPGALDVLTSGQCEPVGMKGTVTRDEQGLARWSFA